MILKQGVALAGLPLLRMVTTKRAHEFENTLLLLRSHSCQLSLNFRIEVGTHFFSCRGHSDLPDTLYVTVHVAVRAPRPATLPRKSWPLQTHSNRQRCGEGLGEGKLVKRGLDRNLAKC